MSINSLSSFGVPGQGGERTAIIQPILTNRFRITFYSFGNPGEVAPYEMTRGVRSVSRPNYTFDQETLHTYLSTMYIATRLQFNDMTLSLFDDIDNQVQSRVQQQLSKQQNFFDQTAARAGQNYKFEMDVDVLAGGASASGTASDPNILQRWSIVGCFITQANMGELTYETPAVGQIDLTIRFDNAVATDTDGNRLGTFDHEPEIASQTGLFTTGIGTNIGTI